MELRYVLTGAVDARCPVCSKVVRDNALSRTSHMSAHVRRGEAVERMYRGERLYFTPPEVRR